METKPVELQEMDQIAKDFLAKRKDVQVVRADAEQIPHWASDLHRGIDNINKKVDDFGKRIDDIERKGKKSRHDELPIGRMTRSLTTEGEPRKDQELENDDPDEENEGSLEQRVEDLENRMERATELASTKDRDKLSKAQGRADSVYRMLGLDSAPAPLLTESPRSYRERLASGIQKFSDRLANTDLSKIQSGPAFRLVEDRIYADSQTATLKPDVVKGRLVPITSTDSAGRTITKYLGDPLAAWGPFMRGAQVVRINQDLFKGANAVAR